MSGSLGEPVSGPVGDPFSDDRGLLFTVAYEILGTVSDAEDAVQDAWERWRAADTTIVEHPRVYATRIVARVALNRLRSAARRRETYVGPWLPEPVLTAPDVADEVAGADEVSTAMLVVLETLSPAERPCSCCARSSTCRWPTSRRWWTVRSRPCASSPTVRGRTCTLADPATTPTATGTAQ